MSAILTEGVIASISVFKPGYFGAALFAAVLGFVENRQYFAIFRTRSLLRYILLCGIVIAVTVLGANVFRGFYIPIVKTCFKNQVLLTRLEVLRGGIEHVKLLIAKGEPQGDHLKSLEKEEAEIVSSLQARTGLNANAEPLSRQVKINFSGLTERINLDLLKGIGGLFLGRFVGIESVMAVSAFQSKSIGLFTRALVEKRTNESPTLFQEISKSPYRYVDSQIWQFASLPGPVAFLFLSGLLSVVFLEWLRLLSLSWRLNFSFLSCLRIPSCVLFWGSTLQISLLKLA
ncbi:MAG: hypothetical protein IPM97_04620 [Bdellovibrionaceae bacterium]|nr:hypothetical protein [Pseudobdellovibrionaceae bacterium]